MLVLDSIATRITRLREERGFTKAELARRAKVSRAYISRLEDGDYADPSGPRLERIATALGVDVRYLLSGERSGFDLPAESDLDPEFRALLAALDPDERSQWAELLRERHKFSQSPEDRASWQQVRETWLLLIQGKLRQLRREQD